MSTLVQFLWLFSHLHFCFRFYIQHAIHWSLQPDLEGYSHLRFQHGRPQEWNPGQSISFLVLYVTYNFVCSMKWPASSWWVIKCLKYKMANTGQNIQPSGWNWASKFYLNIPNRKISAIDLSQLLKVTKTVTGCLKRWKVAILH